MLDTADTAACTFILIYSAIYEEPDPIELVLISQCDKYQSSGCVAFFRPNRVIPSTFTIAVSNVVVSGKFVLDTGVLRAV